MNDIWPEPPDEPPQLASGAVGALHIPNDPQSITDSLIVHLVVAAAIAGHLVPRGREQIPLLPEDDILAPGVTSTVKVVNQQNPHSATATQPNRHRSRFGLQYAPPLR
jgi:hypothetical protein